jgi:tetratricopeptide (TPR) repeat protein
LKSAFRIPAYANEFTYAKAGAAEAPQTPVFHELLGEMYLERNEPKLSVDAYSRAIALDSGNSGFFSSRAKAYSKLSEFEHALKDNDRALLLDSTIAQTWIERSMVRFAMHDLAGAKSDLVKGESLGGIAPAGFRRSLENALKNSGEQ